MLQYSKRKYVHISVIKYMIKYMIKLIPNELNKNYD